MIANNLQVTDRLVLIADPLSELC